MARPRTLPDAQSLRREMTREQLTQKQVAARYGTTRQAVSLALRTANIVDRPRESFRPWIPWVVATRDHDDYLMLMLRMHARDRLGLDVRFRSRLERWREWMDENQTVVDYDRKEGFLLRPRRDGDFEYTRPLPQEQQDEASA